MDTGVEGKLLIELERIKKQNAILKKAVLLEQQKSQSLEATVKEKEIQLRSATEENDLLNFNIGRLTKRTQQLQEQLNEKVQSSNGGGGWFSKTNAELQKKQDQLTAAREELAVKIGENEELHMKIYELKNEYDQTVQTLQQKLSAIKKSLQKSQDDAAEANKVYEENMERFTLEKSNLTSRISELEEIVQGLRKTVEAKEATEKQKNLMMNRDIDRLSQAFQNARPTPAPSNSSTFSSAPVVDSFDHKAAANLIDGGMNALRQLVTAFEEYHGVTKEKLEILVESPSLSLSVSKLLKDLIEMLPKHNVYFEAAFANFTMLSTDIKENRRISFEKKKIFCDSVQDFMKLNTTLLMKQIQYIETDAQVTSPVDEQIISLYNLIQTEVERFCHGTIAFVGTLGYDSGTGYTNLIQYVQQLIATLENLRSHYKSLSAQLQQKFASEYSTAKYANDNIIRSFTSIQLFFGKAITYAKEYLNLVPQPTEVIQPQSDSSAVIQNEDNDIDSNEPELQDWKRRITQIERTLSAKLAEAHAKVTQLEVDKQRLQRELTSVKDAFAAKQAQVSTLLTELAELRKRSISATDTLSTLVKETKSKIQLINAPPANDLLSFENEDGNGTPIKAASPMLAIDAGDRNLVATNAHLTSSSSPSSSPSSSQPPTPTFESKPPTPKFQMNLTSFDEPSLTSEEANEDIKRKKYSMIVVDDSGRESNSLELSDEERTRELAVKRYFEQKLAQLTSQLAIADEKAMRYFGENQLSHQEVHRLLKDKERLQNEIVKLEGLIKISKDDLDLTRSSYEAQQKVLTEFVMNLKDQSMVQEDEIKQLKRHKVRCIKCKNWNTVEWLLHEGRGGQLCRGGNHYSGYNYG